MIRLNTVDLFVNKRKQSFQNQFFSTECFSMVDISFKSIFLDDFKRAMVLDNIVDILTFCVDQHHYTMRNYIVSKDMLRRVLVLMQSKHKFLALGRYHIIEFFIQIKYAC